MGFHDMVSASEAATLSGVSVATLERFAEVGYLTVDSDGDGIPLFSKRELESVFGLNLGGKIATPPAASPVFPSPTTKSGAAAAPSRGAPHMDSLFALLGKPSATGVPSNGAPPSETPAATAPTPELTVTASPHEMSSPPPPLAESTPADETPKAAEPEGSSLAPQPDLGSQGARVDAGLLQGLQAENQKLRHVLDLQERILSMREDEIRDLKSQRDWLHRRLERLEEKSDRDQLLLLSETQTIRKLISLQAPRKSTFRLALEWLGLKSDDDQDSLPIRAHATPIELRTPAAQPSKAEQASESSSPKTSPRNEPHAPSGENHSSRAA